MGLAIAVGYGPSRFAADPEGREWALADLEQVNRVLVVHDLPPHHEPATLPDLPARARPGSLPYSWLHFLRRAVAYARQAPARFGPAPDGYDPSTDDRIDHELAVRMDSHLICHSDADGFYVPIDFPEPLYDADDEDALPGGVMGSSQQALEELIATAPLLGIPLVDGALTDEQARIIATEPAATTPYYRERAAWLKLFEALSQSIEHGCLVVFQ